LPSLDTSFQLFDTERFLCPSTTRMISMTLQSIRDMGSCFEMNARTASVVVAALLCVVAPLDISQLLFAVIGALTYAALQAFNGPVPTGCQKTVDPGKGQRTVRGGTHAQCKSEVSPMKPGAWRPRPVVSRQAMHKSPSPVVKPDVYHPSQVPVSAPKFQSVGWEGEVSELVSQIMPGIDEHQAVQRLVQHVKKAIQEIFPEVEVTGFAHGSLTCGKAFGVAVPEVDIVANVNPIALTRRLQQRVTRSSMSSIDAKKLQKTAIRMCTDRLVQEGGLKFRRSGFRGDEPRVTLLVPPSLALFTEAIPIDFSLNAVTPFYTAALLTESGQFEPRAKALILFVKRWAKDRGICHSAKGHLSPYLWSLLVIYFMQVFESDEGPLLPTAEAFAISSGFAKQSSSRKPTSTGQAPSQHAQNKADGAKMSVAQLFREFVQFYSQSFNFRNEAVAIRRGQRAAPCVSVPLHIVLCNGRSEVAPTIEDPFQAGNNLGTCMNALSLARLREELLRASQLCTRAASLTELLEPWVPEVDTTPEKGGGSSPDEAEMKKSQTI